MVEANCVEIKNCRLCSGELVEFFNVGNSPLANDLVKDSSESAGEFPLRLMRCLDCNCHQLGHDINPDILYRNYAYATSKGLEKHFRNYALKVTNLLGLSEGDKILEIGGNTGLLCQEFKKIGFESINVDPSVNLTKISSDSGVSTYCDYFSEEFADNFKLKNTSVSLVCANNSMAHSNDFNGIVRGIKKILKPNGYLVMEVAYLPSTIKNSDIGQIYRDHFYMFHLQTLRESFSRLGMSVTDVEYLPDIQCGSVRVYVRNSQNVSASSRVSDMTEQEIVFFNSEDYIKFKDRVQNIKNRTLEFLEINKDKNIALIGVTAKIATIIKYFGIKDYFYAAFDDAPLKVNKLVPGTEITIFPMSELPNSGAEICFLGAYNFAEFIMGRFKDLGFIWVQPLPEFKIYENIF